MFQRSPDSAFRRFRDRGDPAALAVVFDRTAPELLRLARHLADDVATAEDLVQATFLTVLERAADHDGQRPVLPWLLGILANHARVARRRSRAPADPSRVPGPRPDADPVDAAATHELRAELATAIEALPEPYRPVLRLALGHGLEPQEIAQVLDRPGGTVRAQLARGLDRLRRALPRGVASAGAAAAAGATASRGLAAVRTEVLQRCSASGSVPVAAVGVAGVLAVMGSKVGVVGLAGLVVAGALLLGNWGGDQVGGDGVQVPSSDPPRQQVASAQDTGAPSASPAVEARRTVEQTAPRVVAAPESNAQALTIRVVRGEARDPVPGLQLRIVSYVGGATQGAMRVTTDDAGEVLLSDPPRTALVVVSALAGGLRNFDNSEGELEFVEIAMPAGLEVRGRVVNMFDVPVPDARILAHGGELEPALAARTDARGEFVLHDVQLHAALEARGPNHAASKACPVHGVPGVPIALELRLGTAPRRITGRVLRPTGEMAPDALVIALPAHESMPQFDQAHSRPVFGRTDAEGYFELFAAVTHEQAVRVVAALEDLQYAPGMSIVPPGLGDAAADVRLQSSATVTGRITGGPQNPGSVLVSTWTQNPATEIDYLVNMLGLRSATPGADGVYRVEGILPGECQIQLRGAGVQASATLRLEAGAEVEHDIVLGGGESLSFRVDPPQSEDPRLTPSWTGMLVRIHADGNREFVALQGIGLDGRVSFSDVEPGEYELAILASSARGGFRRLQLATFGPHRPGGDAIEVQITEAQMPTASVSGRLLDARGLPVAGAVLRLIGTAGARGLCEAEVNTTADGTFEAGALVAGDWRFHQGSRTGPVLTTAVGLLPGEARSLGDLRLR